MIHKKNQRQFDNLLIDGNNLAYRCKFSYNLTNRGVDVSVVYGVIKSIISMITKFKPMSVVVCWDHGSPLFRKQRVPEYKANRHLNDDPLERLDFLRQMNELHKILPLMGIVSVKRHGIEADDFLYHASRILDGTNLIVTGDKDLLQAIDNYTCVHNPGNEGVIFDQAEFESTFNILLKQFIDWKALQGDSSDNIPGVNGIGEKIATKLFNEFDEACALFNAAAGKHPDHKLSDSMSAKIMGFGWDRFVSNVYIMALYADRVGARTAIVHAVDDYAGLDVTTVKQFYLKNAFVSLIDKVNLFTTLEQPVLLDEFKAPIIWSAERVCNDE